MGQIQAKWRGQCSIITALYHYELQGIIACEEAWLKDGKETWKRLIMAHTALDSSFSMWFSSAVNAVVSSAQRSCSLPRYFLSPQGCGAVRPQEWIPNPNAVCFPKSAPASLWIWCLELAVWNLNTQKLVLTVWVMFVRETKDWIFLGGVGRRGEEAQTKQKLKPVTNWLKGCEQFGST